MIRLINHGQIFRYVQSPVSPRQLRQDIDLAIAKHRELCADAAAAKRYQVDAFADAEEAPDALHQLVNQMRQHRTATGYGH